MNIRAIRTEGLGDSTYVLVHDGAAIVVDPQRDVDRFESILNETGAELRFVLETHLHNDYVSGGRDLAQRLGGELVLPSGAAPVFRHRPAFHHEDLNGGPVAIRPIHTPGHTPEHMSYLVVLDGKPTGVFSGGSLLVGSAGRTDLLGEDRADTLARLQYISVNRLAALPDEVGLYPTHGGGSFCTTSAAGKHTSSIGDEKKANPVLAHPDEDSFVNAQLTGLVPYPSYYRYMGRRIWRVWSRPARSALLSSQSATISASNPMWWLSTPGPRPTSPRDTFSEQLASPCETTSGYGPGGSFPSTARWCS